jgi:hypothetical protein
VNGSGSGYLKTVCDYVHLNPVRAKLVNAEDKLSDYRWSSYGEYLKSSRDRQPWLRVERLLGEWGIPKDSAAGRTLFTFYILWLARNNPGTPPPERHWLKSG